MAIYAGQFGPEGLTFPDRSPAINTPVEVQNTDGSPAELFLDVNKMIPIANPTTTSDLGNLNFYAEPGRYRLAIDGEVVSMITVPRHPAEPMSDEDREDILSELLPPISYVQTYENARG